MQFKEYTGTNVWEQIKACVCHRIRADYIDIYVCILFL
jgi:hypothetical protein